MQQSIKNSPDIPCRVFSIYSKAFSNRSKKLHRQGLGKIMAKNTWFAQGNSTLWPRSTVTLEGISGEPPVGKARQTRSRVGRRCLPAARRCLLVSSSTPSSIPLTQYQLLSRMVFDLTVQLVRVAMTSYQMSAIKI